MGLTVRPAFCIVTVNLNPHAANNTFRRAPWAACPHLDGLQVVVLGSQGGRSGGGGHAGGVGQAQGQHARAGLHQELVGVAVVAASELDDLQ